MPAGTQRERLKSQVKLTRPDRFRRRLWADRIGPGVPVLPQHRSSLAVLPRPRRTPGCCGSEPELRRSPCLGGAHSPGMDNACVAINAWADGVMTAQVVPRSATRSTCPRAPRPSIAARSSVSPTLGPLKLQKLVLRQALPKMGGTSLLHAHMYCSTVCVGDPRAPSPCSSST